MKKLNKIFILLALLSFISCGTASVASSSDSEKPEGSSEEVSGQTESENADGSEKQPESASDSDSVAKSGETTEAAAAEEEKTDDAFSETRHPIPEIGHVISLCFFLPVVVGLNKNTGTKRSDLDAG